MFVPLMWDAERVSSFDLGEYVKGTYFVDYVEAHDLNFAPDTPYTGGNYTYRIEVSVSGFLEHEVNLPPDI